MILTMRKNDKNEIKKIVELCEIFQKRLREIISSVSMHEKTAVSLMDKISNKQLALMLRDMDVDTVNRDKLGIRVSALREAGINDMEKLCSMSSRDLSRLKGIGEESAFLIYTVAGKLKQQLSSGFKLRIDTQKQDDVSTQLLCSVRAYMDEQEYFVQAQNLIEEYSASVDAALSEARQANSPVKWFFTSGKRKDAAYSSADYLLGLLRGDYGERCKALIRAWESKRVLTDEECWLDFERNSAAYYANLERLAILSGASIDSSRNGLPEELVRQVELQKISIEGLKATLRSYQDFGVRYIIRQKNVLLGDEMGLGKTVQAIAAMVSLKAAGESHFMVVCPASVLVNWAREIKQFSDLNVVTISGGDIAALRRWQNEGGVAVTTYGSISRFALPQQMRFSMLIADEAHYIKNPLAKRTQALLMLKKRAERCLFMTGTPIENHVDEMCFIIKCLRPDIADGIENMAYFSSAPQFREKLAPVYLRRTRDDVLTELPALVEKEQWCKMGAAEWESYILSVMSENFMAMRQVSWDVSDISKSSKAKRLVQLCEMAAEEGLKVIVFSYFINTINAVCEILGNQALGTITGSVSAQRRQQLVDEFSDSPPGSVLVAQVQAGGTGLNIQAASVIIFCEPQIKPSIENQAISRAYRMGQTKNVVVHRLLCENTVDERILEILRDKQDYFDSFAEISAAGAEYMRGEKSITAAILEMEKKNLELSPLEAPEELEEC